MPWIIFLEDLIDSIVVQGIRMCTKFQCQVWSFSVLEFFDSGYLNNNLLV